jgi:hypothetical protein
VIERLLALSKSDSTASCPHPFSDLTRVILALDQQPLSADLDGLGSGACAKLAIKRHGVGLHRVE